MKHYQAIVWIPHVIAIEAPRLNDAQRVMANFLRSNRRSTTLVSRILEEDHNDIVPIIRSLEEIKDETLSAYNFHGSLLFANLEYVGRGPGRPIPA